MENLEDTDTPTPTPSKARIIVDKIEAFMAGSPDLSVKKYKIAGAGGGGRELERYSTDELLRLLKYWRDRLAAEERRAAGRRRPNIRYSI